MKPRLETPHRRRARVALVPAVLALASALALLALHPAARANPVLTYHATPSRSGNFIMPGLDWNRARSAHLDRAFEARFAGHLYAQPLFWRPPGARRGVIIVATESDAVHAIDAASGVILWSRSLGRPVPRSALPCGDIDPLGITGTPVIDPARGTIYLDAAEEDGSGIHHRVFALSLEDGSILPGWPVDVAAALAKRGQHFVARVQNQRGALALLGGRVFVPFGAHNGDCESYHGWVVGIRLDNPGDVVSWRTRAKGGGIWTPGGISSDGRSLFVATGNTYDAHEWSDGNAVIRLEPNLSRSESTKDYFAPADWRDLDERDWDLGGTVPLPIDLPGESRPAHLIFALGKDGRVYLLNRDDLGGVGGEFLSAPIARRRIITAPAVYPTAGGMFVTFRGDGADCPHPRHDNRLLGFEIRAGAPPSIATLWCAPITGPGLPIVTTTDGRSDPIVWTIGAEGDNRLYAYRGDNGAPLLPGGLPEEPMKGLHHLQTLIAADGRLYVGADGRVYAFSFDRP